MDESKSICLLGLRVKLGKSVRSRRFGHGVMKSEGFFFQIQVSHLRSGNYCVCDGRCTHNLCRTHIFSDTVSLRGVHTSRTRMAQGVCSAHVVSPSHPLLSHVSSTVLAVSAWSLRDQIPRLHRLRRTVTDLKALVWRTSARAARSLATGRFHALHRLWAQGVRQGHFCRRRHDAHQRSEPQ